MSRWLSAAWFEETRSMAATQPKRTGISARMQYEVVGGPSGDVRYFWIVEDGQLLDSGLGDVAEAEVLLTMSWEDALRMQQGELDPNTAFMQGKVKVGGDMGKMMALLPVANTPEYRELQERIREITEY